MCATGSWFAYYDGRTLHEEIFNPNFIVDEDPEFGIFNAIRHKKTFLIGPDPNDSD